MKKIDKYISKNFIKYFILNESVLIIIFLLAQLFRVVRFYQDGIMDSKGMIEYIFNLIPEIFIVTSPLAILMSSLIMINVMASNLEIITLKSSGIKFIRIVIFPIIISTLISFFIFYLCSEIYPRSIFKKNVLRGRIELERELPNEKSNVFYREKDSNLVYYINHINRKTKIAKIIEIIELNESFNEIKTVITSTQGKFEDDVWKLENVYIHEHVNEEINSTYFENFQNEMYNINPDSFITLSSESPKIKSTKELRDTLKKMEYTGEEKEEILLELSYRSSFPFAGIVLSLIGLSLGGKYVRGTSLITIVICISCGYGYYILSSSFKAMSINGHINPFLAGWIPNILFLIAGIYLIRKAEY